MVFEALRGANFTIMGAMRVDIDPQSGFCFGVVRAIEEAERALSEDGIVYCLGDIVHNRVEVQRLESLGMVTITKAEISKSTCEGRMLIRAHGEPPSTYKLAKDQGVEVIDATCPVVAKLQQRVKMAFEQMEAVGGQVVLLGKRGHAEVVGLTGQVDDEVVVVESEADMDGVDFSRPIYFLSQTTQSIALFERLTAVIKERYEGDVERDIVVCDTICRRVSSREVHLKEFASSYDVVIFVSGKKSSNGKVLYDLCRGANSNAYFVEDESEIESSWLEGVESVGICGATSTPAWLMRQVAESIEKMCN